MSENEYKESELVFNQIKTDAHVDMCVKIIQCYFCFSNYLFISATAQFKWKHSTERRFDEEIIFKKARRPERDREKYSNNYIWTYWEVRDDLKVEIKRAINK